MLKCKIERGGYVRVKTKGTAHDLAVETAAMIETVYEETKKKNPEAAKEYKNKVLMMLLDPNSPMWKENNHD